MLQNSNRYMKKRFTWLTTMVFSVLFGSALIFLSCVDCFLADGPNAYFVLVLFFAVAISFLAMVFVSLAVWVAGESKFGKGASLPLLVNLFILISWVFISF